MVKKFFNINIGSKFIRVNFDLDLNGFEYQYWRNKLEEKFKKFILLNTNTESDKIKGILNITTHPPFFIIKKKSYFLEIFKQNSFTNFTTFSYVSHSQMFFLLNYLLNNILIKRGGFILHSSAVSINKNEILIFLGHSGTGKSTISFLLSNSKFKKKKLKKIADDKIIIYQDENNEKSFIAFPCFLDEKNKIAKDLIKFFNIKAFIFLEKSNRNKLIKLKKDSRLKKRLLNVLSLFEYIYYKDEYKNLVSIFEIKRRKIINFLINYEFYNFKFTLSKKEEIFKELSKIL